MIVEGGEIVGNLVGNINRRGANRTLVTSQAFNRVIQEVLTHGQ